MISTLQIVGNLDRGGGQEVVRTLARFLPEEGCAPVVVTLRDGPLRAELEALGIPVEIVAGRTRPFLSTGSVAELRRIRSDLDHLVRRHRAEVVQTHLLRSLDFLVLSLRGHGTLRAVFWTVHNAMLDLRADQLPGGRWLLWPKRAIHRLLYRVGGRQVDAFIAVSADVAEAVQRDYRPPRGKLAVIPNGVDVDRYGGSSKSGALRAELGIPASAPVAIVVAKLMEQKGHRILLKALPAVRRRVPDLHCLFVGDGHLRDEIAARVRDLGLADRVHLLGDRADVPDLMAVGDVFILPSLWEGLPMALLEAMASRLPVIATAVSGTREVLDDGRSGVLVPAGDAEALGGALTGLLEDPERAARLGAAARDRVEECYSARVQARRHAELYRSRLSSRMLGETP
jgi:glycosyltransferase involved in cell wall biosynthesis